MKLAAMTRTWYEVAWGIFWS